MIEIPKSKILVLGGRPKKYLRVSLCLTIRDKFLIEPSVSLSTEEDDFDIREDIMFQTTGIKLINCMLDLQDEIWPAYRESENSAPIFLELMTEVAFLRALKGVVFKVDKGDVLPNMDDCMLRFKKTSTVLYQISWKANEAHPSEQQERIAKNF